MPARLMLGVITLLLWAVEWIAQAIAGWAVRRWADVTGRVVCVVGRARWCSAVVLW